MCAKRRLWSDSSCCSYSRYESSSTPFLEICTVLPGSLKTPPRMTLFPTGGTSLHWSAHEEPKYSRRLHLFFESAMNDFHSGILFCWFRRFVGSLCSFLTLNIYNTAFSKIISISSKVNKAAISSRQSLNSLLMYFLWRAKHVIDPCVVFLWMKAIPSPSPGQILIRSSPSYEKGVTTFSTALLILKIATFSLSICHWDKCNFDGWKLVLVWRRYWKVVGKKCWIHIKMISTVDVNSWTYHQS